MSNVFEVKTKIPKQALKLDVDTSISHIDKFLDGTGYMITAIKDEKLSEMLFENLDLDLEIPAKLGDVIVKGFDDDIVIYSQQAFDLRYDRVG